MASLKLLSYDNVTSDLFDACNILIFVYTMPANITQKEQCVNMKI